MDTAVQLREASLEILPARVPRLAVDAGSRATLKRCVDVSESFGCDVA